MLEFILCHEETLHLMPLCFAKYFPNGIAAMNTLIFLPEVLSPMLSSL